MKPSWGDYGKVNKVLVDGHWKLVHIFEHVQTSRRSGALLYFMPSGSMFIDITHSDMVTGGLEGVMYFRERWA